MGAFQGRQGFAGKLRAVWLMLGSWKRYPKSKRQELISVEKREGKAKVPGVEEAACTPSRDLACLCSKGTQDPAAVQYCFWSDPGHELKQLVENG